MLIVIFSVMLYNYMRITIFETPVQNLILRAQKIVDASVPPDKISSFLQNTPGEYESKIIEKGGLNKPKFIESSEGGRSYLQLHYPYDKDKILSIRADVSVYANIVNQILIDIILVNLVMIFLVVFYAMLLSRTLLMPIKLISQRLASVDEKFLKPIDGAEIPSEFSPLSNSINRLLERIETFILYQKELFIGIAHELKTPLAVMKTKNEVALIKPRESEKYIEALKNNNDSIDNMNKMISSILEIGRQEGAQFEAPEQTDVIAYLKELCVNFTILARTVSKDVELNLSPEKLDISVQKSLFMHVIQNFVQNAIKFSPDGEKVLIESEISDGNFIVRVANKGEPLNEEIDYFAPFKRYGGKPGAGLGLFLAKNAAQAMGAQVDLKNDEARLLIVAIFKLPLKNLRNSPKFRYFKTK
ncbi:HAMP domain-containing sensor histidine kinase [uncultured Campylobacter sp.]|uniref:sensor histidine kinase n=1 Tax=uncultured Campylobacter sp. TaxID=218934 RepID=UPI0026078F75|nr:HAMP domain-containing sensor histidine kinase [uncultured Campylobacter sp.]